MTVKKYSKNNIPRRNYNYGTEGDLRLITATGGTESTVGAYKIHTFTSNGTFAITAGSNQKLEYLAIGGGGAPGRGNGGGACSGAAGGLWMNWTGLSNTAGGQCIGPDMYGKAGDSFAVTVGAGAVALDNNSLQACGGDTVITKNATETYTLLGGGGGGGGTSAYVGYNGGSGGGSAGTGQNGTNMWPATNPSVLNGEYQYQFNFGRTSGPYKQGNGNSDPTRSATVANMRQQGSGGALTLPPCYLTAITDTTRGTNGNVFPGYGIKTSFGGSAVTAYGNAGYAFAQFITAGTPTVPTTPGCGGHSIITTGLGSNGSAGQVIFRYLNSTTVAAANVELLLVGGGGGQYLGGGGGGGSVIYYGNEASNTGGPLTFYTGTYPITVGGGGTRSTAIATSPSGTPTSILGAPTAVAKDQRTYGGFDAFGGSSYPRALGEYIGSGVGAASGTAAPNFTYGLPSPLHGKIGGQSGAAVGGGGGGAGAVGGNATATSGPGGAGGIGKLYTTLGDWGTDAANSAVPTSGKGYFGGGGGGAKTTAGGAGGAAGAGGGGAGLAGTTGVSGSGIANTGGGGGGGIAAATGGAGGSGIVILRYPDIYPPATSTTGTPTVTASGGWRTYTFTQSGSITFG